MGRPMPAGEGHRHHRADKAFSGGADIGIRQTQAGREPNLNSVIGVLENSSKPGRRRHPFRGDGWRPGTGLVATTA